MVTINLPPLPINPLGNADTVAALRAIPSANLENNQAVAVAGNISFGDGAGGIYVWSELTTTADNGTTIIKPTDVSPMAAGRWILVSGGVAGGFYGPAAYEFVATGGQTVFVMPFDMTVAPVVYVNGARLAAADFTYAASTVTLAARVADDIVTIIAADDAILPTTTIDRVSGLQSALDSKATPAYITGVLGSRRANVLDIAGWDPTGVNDMASGYQTLVNQAATAGVPLDGIAGKALLGSTITLPGGHVFEGVNSGAIFIDPTKASSFLIAHSGKGFIRSGGSNAPVSITNQVTVRNQPAPSTGVAYVPTDHDFDYYFADISDLKMSRILTLNATRGIYFNGGRNNIKEWGGQCFKTGLQVDWSYDTCDIQSIHLWPYWNQSEEVKKYMQDNLTSFLLKRVDNSFFNKIFSIWHKYGFYIDWFAGDGPSKPAGTTYKLKLTQADLDIGDYAYWVAAAADGHTAKFSQVTAQARDEIIASSLLTVNGPNCRITGEFNGTASGGNVILCAPSSAGGFLDLVGTGDNWNRTATGFPAVEVQAGGAHVNLLPGSRFTNGNGAAIASGDVGLPLLYKKLTGTANASGTVDITHGLELANQKVLSATAGYKGASSEWQDCVVDYVDGTIVRVTGAAASANVRVLLTYNDMADAW